MSADRRAVAGVIAYFTYSGGETFVLVVKQKGCWSFPKGGVEAEESYEQCAIREFREETGLLLNIESPRMINFCRAKYICLNVDLFSIMMYLRPEKSEEIEAIAWINVCELAKERCNHSVFQFIEYFDQYGALSEALKSCQYMIEDPFIFREPIEVANIFHSVP